MMNSATFLLILLVTQSPALSVDNRLVDPRNDCFERIALEAMLPFEKAFRTEDTNSLISCKEMCIRAGDNCQAISFGVHRRGNGTCQLSSEKIDSTGSRPVGTIFDPDFDLYSRKENCFNLQDNSITSPGTTLFDQPSTPVGPNSVAGTPILIMDPSTVGDTETYPPPPTPTVDSYNTNYAASNDDRRVPPTRRPTATYEPEDDHPTSTQGGDRVYFSNDLYPIYKYPMLYEQNYPAPNQEVYYPGGYAANIPNLSTQYRPYLPTSSDHPHFNIPRPIFGLGYGNGYSYGKPVKYGGNRPTTLGFSSPHDTRPTPSDSDYTRPMPGNNNRYPSPEQDQTTTNYYPRPTNAGGGGNGYNVNPVRPNNGVDIASRPDPTYEHNNNDQNNGGYNSALNPVRPPKNGIQRPGYGYVSHESSYPGQHIQNNSGQEWDDDKKIATFFNPDEYLHGNRKVGQGFAYGQTCFRRVLAGKRVAPHWVRRTLACERIEDCMRECGHEKRFMCEGFNYRLDPSAHGQGDCELIEIPLAQMDLYSSSHQRDANLLRHPDYDYYERDRNAPSSCRKSTCRDCAVVRPESPPLYYKPSGFDKPSGYEEEHYIPPSSSGYGGHGPSSETAVDRYRPQLSPSPPSSPGYVYDTSRPSYSSYEFSPHSYYEPSPPSSYGGEVIDRYDNVRPDDKYRPSRPSAPNRWETLPSDHGSSTGYEDYHHYLSEPDRGDRFRPPYRPGPDYSPYRPHNELTSPHGGYLDRNDYRYSKPPKKFIPYLIGIESDWGSYGGTYGGDYSSNHKQSNYWGIKHEHRRKDPPGFNYFDLGHTREPPREQNSIWNYPGSRYSGHDFDSGRDRHDYKNQWTRRPGPDECSAKTGEGFRLHKTAVKHVYTAPTITECERLCSNQNDFICQTYSYRYSQASRDNCLLCDRPVNLLDYYVDIQPDRDFDIYSMSDDLDSCRRPSGGDSTALSDPRNAQCFFRAIDNTRFFNSIVRDSLNARSIGECELECIKSTKFTCRAFAFRYGPGARHEIIDNCQLSDWPVRDMDKQRHLIIDRAFDVYERASYGHGCEIQPIVDDKHKKSVCYLGYGSPAKLLSTAIKKIISVASESECKKECIRYRENTSFKCYSFSFGSHANSFNCEMSDLDQTELKLNVHYTHTHERDYWLFAWNPFDWTCRDKVNTIGGSRVNNDRRMDIFREPGDITWRHYTVSGKACRVGSPCEKNLVTGFYSCETENGEIGSWDYCCKADHPCGYSQGFDYPWCFVGDELDQWRKCSDRYYPGNKTHTETHSSITIPPQKDKKKHTTTTFQRPPRPGGLQSLNDFTAARLWPVTYLYSEGPPNATEFSNFVDCNKESC